MISSHLLDLQLLPVYTTPERDKAHDLLRWLAPAPTA